MWTIPFNEHLNARKLVFSKLAVWQISSFGHAYQDRFTLCLQQARDHIQELMGISGKCYEFVLGSKYLWSGAHKYEKI